MFSNSQWSTVNVACVTYNNGDTVATLLDSLLVESAYISEVSLHDNGSVDDTLARVRAWLASNKGLRVKVTKGTNVGFSAGVYGACEALEDKSLPTLCLNPDAILSEHTLGELLNAMNSDSSIGIATTPLIMSDGQMDPSCVRTLPRFGSSVLYSLIGKLSPARFRYNAAKLPDLASDPLGNNETTRSVIEATTGALMLVNPRFRPASFPIFDLSYWMYGEDLQLCKDAAEEHFSVVMIHHTPSVHLKGVSSGWPRSSKANKAFHDALFLYFSKNFSRGPVDRLLGKLAIATRFGLSEVAGSIVRTRRDRARRL